MPEYTTFLDNTAYPPYSHLPMPGQLGFDPTAPDEHWCLLAEIVQPPLDLMRARTVLRDVEGQELVLAFYVNNPRDIASHKMRVGHTMAVFYATQHYFLDGSEGVRCEELGYAKVFPIGIKDLFKVGNEIRDYNMVQGKNKCHGCDAEKEGLQKCARCGFFFYCDKDCQAKGWNEKGHKNVCKVIKDPDFRKMLEWQYEPFSEPRFKFSSFAV